jgi:L-ascorbate metabolism protein UlaG (beta-lactamase superfamily)
MRRLALLVLLSVVLSGVVVSAATTVEYLGHSCFTITSAEGLVVMMDPYASYVPYPALPQPADIVLITHGHIDHCPRCYGETDRVTGSPIEVLLLDANGRCREKTYPAAWVITEAFRTQAVEGSHVTKTGGGQGYVCMYSFVIDGIRFAHLGDLGQPLSQEQIAALGDVQVLFIPVGGTATLDASDAAAVVESLPSLRVAIPMHYAIDGLCPWPFAEVTPFVELATSKGWTTRELDASSIALEALPEALEVWVLDYKR